MAFQDYARPSVAVDIVLLAILQDALQVLLIRRRNPPHRGYWALPGGFVDIDEALGDAALRELEEETNVHASVELEQLYTFGDPRRDPRGRVISVAYLALAGQGAGEPSAGSDAAEVGWWHAHNPPPLAFDHDRILDRALIRLRERLVHDPAHIPLIPARFSLGELHRIYEIMLKEALDPADFSEAMVDSGRLERVPDVGAETSRQSGLFRFRTSTESGSAA